MTEAAKKFNALDGRQVSRSHIEEILRLAKLQKDTVVVFRLARLLNENPDDDYFEVEVKKYPALSGAMHSGIYKEALDSCGRLNPGWKFENGAVVKVEKKPKNNKKVKILPNPNVKKEKVEKAKKAVIKLRKTKVEKPKPTVPAAAKKSVKKVTAVKPKPTAPAKAKASGIFSLAVGKISLDKARFQNRNKLNETVLQQIVDNYNDTKLDPVIVWIDPKDKKTYLLAGHHRFEATLRVGRKAIPVKYFEGTEAEAIKYAKVESNANRSLELPQERAKIYREMIKSGTSKAKVFEEARKLEGKNANYILNLSFLEPKGIVMQALDSLSDTGDKQNATLIEKIADWIGEAKRKYELTPLHEKEMFDFLQDKEASKRFSTKSEFIQKITAIAGGFDFDAEKPLNLKSLKYKSEGETAYDAEMKELKTKLDALIEKRIELKERLKNPSNPGYINPASKDYEQTLQNFDKTVAKISDEIKVYQAKIIDLQRKKGQYTAAGSNQAALFGAKVKKSKKPALKQPDIQQPGITLLPGELLPEVQPKTSVRSGNTIADRLNSQKNKVRKYFKIDDPDLAELLGQIEIKEKESVAITLTGEQGSMKTRLCFILMNAFGQNYKVGHASKEEHPESGLYFDKVEQYLNNKAIHNISAPEINSIDDVHKLAEENDIIIIDSFTKLQELDKNCELDKDFRKKYHGKLFIIIYQTTSDGKMRGGSKSQFDGDIVLFIKKFPNYKENYAYADKNRYQNKNLEELKYNIFHQKLQNGSTAEQSEPETVSAPEVNVNQFSFNVK